jgi:hypothetical protein
VLHRFRSVTQQNGVDIDAFLGCARADQRLRNGGIQIRGGSRLRRTIYS